MPYKNTVPHTTSSSLTFEKVLLLCCALFFGVFVGALDASPVDASDLAIPVFSAGKPAPGVWVCAGSKQERALYGRVQTDERGNAHFKGLPDGKILFTATLSGRTHETMMFGTNNPFSAGPMIALPNEPNNMPGCPEITASALVTKVKAN